MTGSACPCGAFSRGTSQTRARRKRAFARPKELGECLAVLELVGEPLGGAPQVVVAGLEELRCGLGVLRDCREEEALLGEMAVVRGLEALQARAGRLAAREVAGA